MQEPSCRSSWLLHTLGIIGPTISSHPPTGARFSRHPPRFCPAIATLSVCAARHCTDSPSYTASTSSTSPTTPNGHHIRSSNLDSRAHNASARNWYCQSQAFRASASTLPGTRPSWHLRLDRPQPRILFATSPASTIPLSVGDDVLRPIAIGRVCARQLLSTTTTLCFGSVRSVLPNYLPRQRSTTTIQWQPQRIRRRSDTLESHPTRRPRRPSLYLTHQHRATVAGPARVPPWQRTLIPLQPWQDQPFMI